MQVATKLGIPQSVISQYERGDLRLHGQLLIRLSRILELQHQDEILGLKESKESRRREGPALPSGAPTRIERLESARSAGTPPHDRRVPLQGLVSREIGGFRSPLADIWSPTAGRPQRGLGRRVSMLAISPTPDRSGHHRADDFRGTHFLRRAVGIGLEKSFVYPKVSFGMTRIHVLDVMGDLVTDHKEKQLSTGRVDGAVFARDTMYGRYAEISFGFLDGILWNVAVKFPVEVDHAGAQQMVREFLEIETVLISQHGAGEAVKYLGQGATDFPRALIDGGGATHEWKGDDWSLVHLAAKSREMPQAAHVLIEADLAIKRQREEHRPPAAIPERVGPDLRHRIWDWLRQPKTGRLGTFARFVVMCVAFLLCASLVKWSGRQRHDAVGFATLLFGFAVVGCAACWWSVSQLSWLASVLVGLFMGASAVAHWIFSDT